MKMKEETRANLRYTLRTMVLVGLGSLAGWGLLVLLGVVHPPIFEPEVRYVHTEAGATYSESTDIVSVLPDTRYIRDRSRRVAVMLAKETKLDVEEIDLYTRWLVNYSIQHMVDPLLSACVLVVETRGNKLAVSNKHAIGLMQINLSIWAERWPPDVHNYFHPETNIMIGTTILGEYLFGRTEQQGLRRYIGMGMEGEGYAEKVLALHQAYMGSGS